MPKNPVLIINHVEQFMKAMKPHIKLKNIKKSKAKKKVPAKKKAKAKIKSEITRPSPFQIGDEVWYEKTSGIWVKGKIIKRMKPGANEKSWYYYFDPDEDSRYEESKLLPAGIFQLMATDAIRMKIADFCSNLNKTFDGNATIFTVFRQGQKRPWAYYVIPDWNDIVKEVKWSYETYYEHKYYNTANLYVCPAAKIELKCMPISSAPQEILTYLGLHIYNRLWKKGVE